MVKYVLIPGLMRNSSTKYLLRASFDIACWLFDYSSSRKQNCVAFCVDIVDIPHQSQELRPINIKVIFFFLKRDRRM